MEPIRVLIVDDEPNARQVLQKKVNWGAHAMSVVGSATNGIEAVEFLRDNDVDVVFMDMKMPFMDGNRAIQEIKDIGKRPKFVVLSAYSDYQYVRASFKLGVADYLLKNHINSPTMDVLLDRLRRDMSAGSTDSQDVASGSATVTDSGIAEGLCIAARVPPRFRPRLEQLLQSIDGASTCGCTAFEEGEFTIITIPYAGSLDAAETVLPRGFLGKLSAIAALGVAVAQTAPRRAAAAAQRACTFGYYKSEGAAVEAGEITQASGRIDTDGYKVRLHRIVRQIDLVAARTSFRKLFDEIARVKPEPSVAIAIVTDVYSFYLDQLYTMDAIPSQLAFGVAQIERELTGYPRFSYVREYVFTSLSNIERFFERSLSNDLSSVLSAYIDSHIGDDLSLESLSRVFGKSPGYLSVVFSRSHPVSLRKYVNQKRIARAVSYLQNFNLRVKDVAELVGFKSTEHFSRTFRRHTGRPPSDFRQSP